MTGTPSDPIELQEYHPWRRVIVFLVAFILCASATLTFAYTRPADYLAKSRLQISPARDMAEAGPPRLPNLRDEAVRIATEVQVLTSRAVLQDTVRRLKSDNAFPDLGRDPIGVVQHLLQSRIIDGTQVVELSAEGREPIFLRRLLNTVADAYRDRSAQQYKQRIAGEYQDLKEEVENLRVQASTARAKMDEFREANGIISAEGESVVTADLQNLSRAYSASVESLAKAQAHLQALKNMLNAGLSNDASVAALEQRAATLRDQLDDLQRRFTPQYMALDPDTKSLPGRVADLDGQIATQRTADQEAAILAAEEELQKSSVQFDQLRGDLIARQSKAEQFAARLSEYKGMQDDLNHIEQTQRLTADRLTTLQASQRERAPRVDVLQAAAVDASPIRPDYMRNILIAIAGSFALGILAAWFSDFFTGPPAVAYCEPPMHMQCWDGTPALTYERAPPHHFGSDPGLIRLLPPPDPASSA
jgi:polysaccharide biosynthesis transport protein